jgi:hypothetical protein
VNPEAVPTGNTSQVVEQYYDYLYSHYLAQITQTYSIHWDVLAWILFWVVLLAGLFYAYTRYQRYTHFAREPYPLESYNGYVSETNGPVGTFLAIFMTVIVVWLLLTTIYNRTYGQIY